MLAQVALVWWIRVFQFSPIPVSNCDRKTTKGKRGSFPSPTAACQPCLQLFEHVVLSHESVAPSKFVV